ncbi:Tex family protein [Jeotgalibacillus sp. R-1-5s-1]|uniref:Tex family protein n=1 Tax=Jeotgalibacillus sp. R-1-5s-1 TaxID=2555897 RepID=UPI001069C316|nr:Tex family protein [Jeotgalibacillus sp. R-1-5s-1]TFD95305.1 RNA-binding transcriptional accessory protein [Jeotgalibacillus sp. R-1-5s-1]
MDQRKEQIGRLSKEISISAPQIEKVIQLLDEGNTVPFIARYRKEMTGALDEVQIKDIADKWDYLLNLENRKEEVLRLIEEQGKLTDELKTSITAAAKLQTIEDLYRPFRQKRSTRATKAKEKGLEPLAEWLLHASPEENIKEKAAEFISEEKGVESAADAIAGAQDIIAEMIADDAKIREYIRNQTMRNGKIISKVKKQELDEKGVFEMYYDYEEPVSKIVPHRILALNRGEKEEILRVSIQPDQEQILAELKRKRIKYPNAQISIEVEAAVEDSYKRLIHPSIEREIRNELTEKAENQAIHIFSENLKNLLLQAPLKGKKVLGVDPAYRTGCKLAVVDETGKMLHIAVIYPHTTSDPSKAAAIFRKVVQDFDIELVAIGNGTASRETEQFVAEQLKQVDREVYYLIVNEAGASVYSASDVAREEFPDLQVEERSAVSIARRLQDPLAELVKIDPKSVGVGQYQHDVSQKKLNESLTFVVETAVNKVGVNVNTASPSLLQYVAGLSKTVAQNIVKARDEAGKFESRTQLKKIPRLGAKTYEQCIGFLRIAEGKNPLDRTAIHPENYKDVEKMLDSAGFTKKAIGSDELKEAIIQKTPEQWAEETNIGIHTMRDIIEALIRPGRDPRDELDKPLLKQDVLKMEDLSPGMELQGTVRNVVDFGAFVDIGVKQDGLVHISKLKKGFVKHPLDVVALGDVVTVWIEQVDVKKGRIALTMLQPKDQTS